MHPECKNHKPRFGSERRCLECTRFRSRDNRRRNGIPIRSLSHPDCKNHNLNNKFRQCKECHRLRQRGYNRRDGAIPKEEYVMTIRKHPECKSHRSILMTNNRGDRLCSECHRLHAKDSYEKEGHMTIAERSLSAKHPKCGSHHGPYCKECMRLRKRDDMIVVMNKIFLPHDYVSCYHCGSCYRESARLNYRKHRHSRIASSRRYERMHADERNRRGRENTQMLKWIAAEKKEYWKWFREQPET